MFLRLFLSLGMPSITCDTFIYFRIVRLWFRRWCRVRKYELTESMDFNRWRFCRTKNNCFVTSSRTKTVAKKSERRHWSWGRRGNIFRWDGEEEAVGQYCTSEGGKREVVFCEILSTLLSNVKYKLSMNVYPAIRLGTAQRLTVLSTYNVENKMPVIIMYYSVLWCNKIKSLSIKPCFLGLSSEPSYIFSGWTCWHNVQKIITRNNWRMLPIYGKIKIWNFRGCLNTEVPNLPFWPTVMSWRHRFSTLGNKWAGS